MISMGWWDFPPAMKYRVAGAASWDSHTSSHSTLVSNVRNLLSPYNATYDDDGIFHFESEGDYAMFLLRWA